MSNRLNSLRVRVWGRLKIVRSNLGSYSSITNITTLAGYMTGALGWKLRLWDEMNEFIIFTNRCHNFRSRDVKQKEKGKVSANAVMCGFG